MRAALIFLLFACEDVGVREYEPRSGLINGTVIFQAPPASNDVCTPVPTGGNAVITLFTQDNPPPPAGTGSPINFIVVPEQLFFREGNQGAGLFAAPFTMPSVPSGQYTVRGFLDADEDFRPTVPLLAQPTAGDVGGAHIDPVTREIRTIGVIVDQVTEQVTVTLALPIPAERPAFAITSTPSFAVPFATPQTLVIESHPINTTDIHMTPECTRFLVSYADDDGDGAPDDLNGDHLPDVYPRVVLRLRDRAAGEPPIIIPAIINPLPFLGALAASPYVATTMLELILPPVAVERGPAGDTLLDIPAGDYDTIVIAGTGQTWQVPNDLSVVQPNDAPDPTQAQVVTMREGQALPPGAISGVVATSVDATGDVYVIAFDAADPPPPAGSGRPRGLATVRRDAFTPATGQREAPYLIRGLADGTYLVVAVLDADGDLSPLVDLLAQPSAGDWGGSGGLATVNGAEVEGIVVPIDTPFLFDRPAFEHDAISIPRTAFPAILNTRAHAIDALGISAESARVPVLLAGTDLEGDNLPDLFPRVILTGDDGTIIPGIVDPLPHLAALGGGAPFIPADGLRVILPPVALVGTERVSPPPAGRYRVNVLSATGQTWSVPNEVNEVLGTDDPTQAAYVTIEDTPVPGGAIVGTVRLLAPAPAGEYQAIVLAFAKDRPPPPRGSGRPLGIAIVPSSMFAGGVAPYAIGGLATGVYQVRAFLDANDDFTPWFDAMNQPNAGDIGGGYLALPQGTLQDVNVDALGAPAVGIEVSIVDALQLPTDRPSFSLPAPLPVLDLSQGPLSVAFDALREATDVLTTNGIFPVQWIDLNGDGNADDVNGDGNPDVYPIVVAELLDPNDPENLTPDPGGIRIPGFIDPGQFAPLGFPAGDPTQTATVVLASTFSAVFPPLAVPAGKYRVTLINPAGQTWTLPNELQRAAGTVFVETQGGYLTVRD